MGQRATITLAHNSAHVCLTSQATSQSKRAFRFKKHSKLYKKRESELLQAQNNALVHIYKGLLKQSIFTAVYGDADDTKALFKNAYKMLPQNVREETI
jgi:hypothetical protein